MFAAVTTKELNKELIDFRFKTLLTLAAVATKQLHTELRGLTLEMLLTLDAGKKGLLLSNNVATSDKSTCIAVAGLTLSSLLFTSKSGYGKKWQRFTCTKNLSSTASAGFAGKHGR